MIADISAKFAGMDLGWWLAMAPAAAIALIAMAARLTQGSWLAPGAAWAGFWTGAVWLPLLLAPKYPVSAPAVWVIAAFSLVFYFGSNLGQGAPVYRVVREKLPRPNSLMRPLCMVGTLAGFLMTGLTLVQYQSSWSVWLSPARLGDLANTISVARYAGDANESVLVRFCLVFCYLGSLAGGHAMAWRPRVRLAWWSVGPVVATLSYTLLTTAKAGLLIAILLWLAAFVTESMRRRGRSWQISWKMFALGSISIALVVTLFVVAMVLRYGSAETDDRQFVIERLRNYSVSHLTAFSSWWEAPRVAHAPTWGRQSLFGPAALLNLTTRQQGVYEVILSDDFPVDSNLFTFYRSIIADFTLPGALLVMSAIGFVAGRAYRKTLTRPHATGAALIMTAYYTTLGWSHIVNVFGYTTLLLAFSFYALATRACRRGSLRSRFPVAASVAVR